MKTKIAIVAFFIFGFTALYAQVLQNKFQVDCFEIPEKAYADDFDVINVTVKLKCEVKNYHLSIYNSWDEIVFESTDPNETWGASTLPMGVYSWVFTANMTNTIPAQILKEEGTITLVQ